MPPLIHNIQKLILERLHAFPDARFVTDTQLVLDPGTGTLMSIETLLGMLEEIAEPYHHEVIDQFVGALTRSITQLPAEADTLDRREVLGSVTRLIYPEDVLPDVQNPQPLAPGLVTAWALAHEDTLAVMPPEKLTAHATEEDMDRAARARVRAYARGLTVVRELGGVLLHGGRQTTSVALYVDDCVRAVKLSRCAHGYFVSVPDRTHCIIVPATKIASLLPMMEVTVGTFLNSAQQFSPFIYHWIDGTWHALVTDAGVTPTPELLALHGPVDLWDQDEDYWDGDAA